MCAIVTEDDVPVLGHGRIDGTGHSGDDPLESPLRGLISNPFG